MNGFGRFVVVVDSQHLYYGSRAVGFTVDFKRFLEEMRTRGQLIRIYCVMAVDEREEYQSLRKLADWMAYNGYTVVQSGVNPVEIAMHVATACFEMVGHVDDIVLVAGNFCYAPFIRLLKGKGIRVTVISTLAQGDGLVASAVRREADTFLDLQHMRASIEKTRSE